VRDRIKEPRQRRGSGSFVAPLVVLALCALPAAPASAHAERIDSNPEENAQLDQAPESLSINFTEPPTGDARLEVLDGCKRDVTGAIKVQNQSISAPLDSGQPGTWRVTSTVISGVDGHQTEDSWTFRVSGEPDCSQAAAEPDEEETGEEEGGDFPVVPVLLGGAVFAVAVVLLRVLTGRSDD
jgi:methionine-rich copper-binding protein CopC